MSTAGTSDANLVDAQGIELFLTYVSSMLERADFLIPLVAGQRQFREDNYQMSSAAQLEDLFHDALGMFLRENHPRVDLKRRTGKESWDYAVGDVQFSHKESQSPSFSVWWTGGDEVEGKFLPKRPTWRYEYSIVFVYTAISGPLVWRFNEPRDHRGDEGTADGTFSGLLGLRAIKHRLPQPGRESLVLATPIGPTEFRVDRVWPAGAWEDLDFQAMWPELGGQGLSVRDLWLDKQTRHGQSGLGMQGSQAVGRTLALTSAPMLPGIYVFDKTELGEIPLVANNRAHVASPEFVLGLMDSARTAGRYLPLPLWFARYATAEPPNLYGRQRAQFELLFAPRNR